ncbi:MAG TPA: amino acid ABC transporter substrate-binding protein [Firmicutes bacterium]|nr:amino acid ABC transporter substrate-binding protein [Bacillota bacterium]
MKRITTAFILMTLLAFTFSGCGNQQKEDSWKEVQKKGEFVLGLDDSFPPMGYRDENGEITGFDIDLAKEVCARLQINLKVQPISWDAKEQELNTKNIDCIWNGLTITEERKKTILFSEPYMDNRQILVVRADSKLNSLSDLAGKRLGLQAGSSAMDALNGAPEFKDHLAEVVEFDDNMTALMDLEMGGLDAVLMDEIVARFYIQQKNKSYLVLDEALASEEYGIGFRKSDSELRDKVQAALEEMAADGSLAEISTKWFGEDITVVAK